MTQKAVVILSGGMDSTVLAHELASRGLEVHAIGIDYGQRHVKELAFALEQALAMDIPFEVVDLGELGKVLAGSALTSDDVPVPEGHYEDESMKATVVPNRNMILLAVAIGKAVAIGAKVVAYGAHAGDHAIYPDCREEFAAAMSQAALLCDYEPITLLRPFVNITKADIAARGQELGVNFAQTWSCYQGGDLHCGRCGTCVERIEAFADSGVPDPTQYEPRA